MNPTRRDALKIIAAGLLAPALPVPKPDLWKAIDRAVRRHGRKTGLRRILHGGSRSGKTLDLINPKVLQHRGPSGWGTLENYPDENV